MARRPLQAGLGRWAPLWIAACWLAGSGPAFAAEPAHGPAAKPAAAPQAKPPAAEPEEVRPEKLAQWIAQLGDKDYFLRQRAQEELIRLGFQAFDALSEAANNEDLEIASRARYVLRLIRVEWTVQSDPSEVKRQFQNYEYLDPEQRQARMRALAALPNGAGIPALCRLARFEQSNVLSKHAALEILAREAPGQAPKPDSARLVGRSLGSSRRPATAWLRCWARFAQEPEAALAEWTGLAEAEHQLLRHSPGETDVQLVSALLRFRINWLEKLDHGDEALAAMSELIDLEKGDPETLVDLVQWLVEQKAWRLIDEVSSRFAVRFSNSVLLLYALAEAQAVRGDQPAAEKMAQRARELNANALEPNLRVHVFAAQRLWRRGRFEWAKQEYEGVLARGRPGKYATIKARFELAEMLHDQADDLVAAGHLKALAEEVGKDKPGDEEVNQLTLAEVRSRMHYFYACHYERIHDRPQQRQHLEAALAANSADIDGLIAAYRLPDDGGPFRDKVRELIRKTAEDLQNEITAAPEEHQLLNQYAWLIGNTEGDYDLALKYSQTSLELSPDNGGYYDTLARVCHAKKDYAGAVENQAKAVRFDPHSGQIARQLEFFQAELKRSQQKK